MARRDDEYWRERAKVLYRALRDDYGPRGATVRELMPLIGATGSDGVFMALNWLRAQGVRVVCARSAGPSGEPPPPSRWALLEALPPGWAEGLPSDGSPLEVIEGTTLNEVVYPVAGHGPA